ncbi:MAG: hypothetical protein WBM78_25565 [Desulfobacterales bacterium]
MAGQKTAHHGGHRYIACARQQVKGGGDQRQCKAAGSSLLKNRFYAINEIVTSLWMLAAMSAFVLPGIFNYT